MTRLALIQRLSVVALGWVLAACAGGTPPAAGVTVASPTAVSPASLPATATQPQPPAVASPLAEATSLPTATAILPTEALPPTEAVALFNGIPQGYTDDGFPYLGDPAAPVTLTDYSDFL
jgi:hypothetical protein